MGTNEAEDLVTFVDDLMMPVRTWPRGGTQCIPRCASWLLSKGGLQLRNPTTGLQNRQLFGFVERISWHFVCTGDAL